MAADRHQAVYTGRQCRDLDRIAMEAFGYCGETLMQRAGQAAFDRILERFGDCEKFLVLCGTGNNAGDGYVVAALAQRIGIPVQVIATGVAKSAHAMTMSQRFLRAGGRIRYMDCDQSGVESELHQRNMLIVDALLGTGISRPAEAATAHLIRQANAGKHPIVALDVPSGCDADTGKAFEPCIQASLTVTFVGNKLGLMTGPGREKCGERVFESLSLQPDIHEQVPAHCRIIQPEQLIPRTAGSHKGHFGHVLIAGGNRGMLGAAALAGGAALRTGSGRVTVLCPEHSVDRLVGVQPELMTRGYSDSLPELSDFAGIVIGPGLGQDSWAQTLFGQLMKQLEPPDDSEVSRRSWNVVVDADGLNLLAGRPIKYPHWILTPHPGEAARLLGVDVQDVLDDRLGCADAIVAGYGGICVLKGAGTVVVAEHPPALVLDVSNPGMATAGTGDVLSGMIAGLLAQRSALGFTALDAVKTAVWAHGRCAQRARDRLGEVSLLAGDLVAEIPAVCLELMTEIRHAELPDRNE